MYGAALGLAMNIRRVWRLVPLTALAVVGGCFATRSDVRIVQSDIATLRTELSRRDAEQKEQLVQAMRLITIANDSLTRISARTVGIQGDVRGEMRQIKEQLLQVQSLLGQSQANLNRFRAELEARNNAPPPVVPPVASPTTPPTTSTPPATPPTGTGVIVPTVLDTMPKGPGPAQLYQTAMDNLRRGSTSTARTLFQELLSNYPTSDLAPVAQLNIGESLSREKNLSGADAAYAAVVTKYPDSPQAPNALYKRAQIALDQGNKPEARKLWTEVGTRYPKSLEAELAAERLKEIR
jgi:tol-pal system protein YbgF